MKIIYCNRRSHKNWRKVRLDRNLRLAIRRAKQWTDNKEREEPDRELPMDIIRRCGGFREYANRVVMGPIL